MNGRATHGTGFLTKLPEFFFNPSHPVRWFDEFAPATQEEAEDYQPTLEELRLKFQRNRILSTWLKAFQLPVRQLKFQRVRVVRDKTFEPSKEDWWLPYHGAIFTVFMQPVTMKWKNGHVQFYILVPPDCELVHRYEITKKEPGKKLPLYEPMIQPVSHIERLRQALIIPVKCCQHIRNERSGGKLDFEVGVL